MNTIPLQQLEAAIGKGSTAWLRDFIRDNLPCLIEGGLSPEDFADRVSAQLDKRQLTEPRQQKNYRSNLAQAIKAVSPRHPAIELVQLSTESYRDLGEAQAIRLAERHSVFISPEQAEELVALARKLIKSSEWSEVGAGLAVLIGRRISEILTSDYAPKSAWTIWFSGFAKKKKIQTEIEIEIPTLAPADEVLRAIEKLHRYLGKSQILKEAQGDIQAARKLSYSRYAKGVCAECDRQFAELIPPRSGRDRLYTHIFRAVYATVATHWFCPPYVLPHQYKAEIQGHFTIGKDGQKLPSYGSRGNYDDYAIGDGKGNLGGIGIKLGTLPELEVIEAFKK